MSPRNLMMPLMVFLLLMGCAKIQLMVGPLVKPLIKKKKVVVCADRYIKAALRLHEKAKVELAHHFEDRNPSGLYVSYYVAEDSINEARRVRKCKDRQPRHFYAMKNLLRLNRSLQKVARVNMREDDPGELIAIYREQYHDVMYNDIK